MHLIRVIYVYASENWHLQSMAHTLGCLLALFDLFFVSNPTSFGLGVD